MNSQNRQCYQVTLPATSLDSASRDARREPLFMLPDETIECPPVVEGADAAEILHYLRSGRLWMVNSRRRNGLILCKSFYAEFAGPGAAVGGIFDLDCQRVIPVGDLSMLQPDCHEERQKAYLIRRQWIRLTQQFTDQSVPLKRAQMILNQFENYFDQDTIARIPDEAFAMLVGVLPHSVRMARRRPGKLNVKVKA
jgi:hypothetical protein